jgi:outer membrane protein TolC
MLRMFKSKIIYIISVLFISPLSLIGGEYDEITEETKYYTLQECIDYAIDNNENVKIAELETDVSQAKVGEYLSRGLPQVDGTISFNKNFVIRKTFVPANMFDPTAPEGELLELAFGTPYDGIIGLNVSQMVINGSFFVGLSATKTFVELSRKEYQRTTIDVVEAVTKAYFTVLVNEIGINLLEANHKRLDSLLTDTKVMFENGFAEKIDVHRTQVEYNNVETQLINARKLLDVSEQLLKFQMGMPVMEDLEIIEKLEDMDFQLDELFKLETSFTRRIEYAILETQLELAYVNMKNNKVQYIPNVDLILGWGMNAGVAELNNLWKFGEETIWPSYSVAGLSMYIPIFDGLYKSKMIQQNKLQIQQLGYRKEMLENNINREVLEKRTNVQASLDQLENQQENMKLAEEVFNMTRIKYQEGVGSNLEVIEADNALVLSQTNYYNALYDALLSKIDLEKALGVLETNVK